MLDFKISNEILAAASSDTLVYAVDGKPSLEGSVPAFIMTDKDDYPVGDLPVYIRNESTDQTLIPLSYQKNAPYEGRIFLYGLFDCYTLILDWYKREKGINLLSNINRQYGWWLEEDKSPYLAHFETVGARDVIAATQPGDVMIYNLGHMKAAHGAVLDNDGMMLHHFSGELSKRKPKEWMASKVMKVLRLRCL